MFSEQFFNANQIGEKIDPCFQFARKSLPPSVAVSVWGSLQALLFLGLQNIPEQGEKGTGERVEVQIGADENLLALTVRFELPTERLGMIRSSPLLALPRFSAGLFEFRFLGDGNQLELNCLFFAAKPPERTVEVLTFQKQTALEDRSTVQEYSFKTFASLSSATPQEKRVIKGGFKNKFSDKISKPKATSAISENSATIICPSGSDDDFVKNLASGSEERIDAITTISGQAPIAEQKIIVSGGSTLGAKETVTVIKGSAEVRSASDGTAATSPAAQPRDKSAQITESKIFSLEETLKQRDELVAKLNKEIAEIKDPMKIGVITGIKNNQMDGMKANIARLQAELEEAGNKEKKLMTILDKAVQMKDEAMKRLKELEVKLKATAGGKSSQVTMLERQIEEQKRQNKEMGKRVAGLIEQIQQAGMRPAA